MEDHCSASGDLDTDSFPLALMTYRNTPCRYLGQSPSQILFMRKLKDALPQSKSSLQLRPEWIKTAEEREKAMARRHLASTEVWSRGVRNKDPLEVGSAVAVQSLVGKGKHQWSLSGTVMEVAGPESYWIKLDGSGRLSKRKRQHLKLIVPYLDIRIPSSHSDEEQNNHRMGTRSRRIVENS